MGLSTALCLLVGNRWALALGGLWGERPYQQLVSCTVWGGQCPALCDVPIACPVLHTAPTVSGVPTVPPTQAHVLPASGLPAHFSSTLGGAGRGAGVQLEPWRLLSEHVHRGHWGWVQGASLGGGTALGFLLDTCWSFLCLSLPTYSGLSLPRPPDRGTGSRLLEMTKGERVGQC